MMTENAFLLCHINIRSQKANLKPFEICLENLEFQFSVIGLTETWLKDFNSDLYNIDGYNFVETHRTEKPMIWFDNKSSQWMAYTPFASISECLVS